MQLSDLVKTMGEGVSLMGVVKPEAVPQSTLLEFYSDYFPFPLYQDDDWQLFTAMGKRQTSLWSLISNVPKLNNRYNEKGIHNIPFGGDLFTNGGLLIFDSQQRLRFVYFEKYGDELDMEAVEWAIEQARKPWKGREQTQSPKTCGAPAVKLPPTNTDKRPTELCSSCTKLSSPWASSANSCSRTPPRRPQRHPSPSPLRPGPSS